MKVIEKKYQSWSRKKGRYPAQFKKDKVDL